MFGAGGRMGATVCEAVEAADDLELVAAVDPAAAGGEAAGSVPISAEREVVSAAGAEVAVDFTVAAAARENLEWCAGAGVHAVSGTTGLEEGTVEHLRELFGSPQAPNCVLAPNFSVGAVLMMRCAELCAPHFEGVEIIELHHAGKRDAPSGTSLETARRIEAARAGSPLTPDPTERETLPHPRGGEAAGGVRVHSIRLPGLVAHQEVIFGSSGETLRLRHDSSDRSSFMPGVLLAVRRVPSLPGLTRGLEALLGL